MKPERTRQDSERMHEGLRVQQRAIAGLGLFALDEHSRERVSEEVVRVVRDAIGSDYSKILEKQPDGALLVTSGAGWPPGIVGALEVAGGGHSQASHALETGDPVLVEDLAAETRFEPSPTLLDLGVRSGINVIIPGVEGAYGVLEVDAREPRRFNPDEIHFLQSAANVLGGALDREARAHDREQFFDAVAHELRTPLAAVLGFSGRLVRNLEPGATVTDQAAEELTAILDGARRMQRSINMLLQMTQLERGSALPPEPIELRRLVHDLVQDTQDAFPAVAFDEHYPEDEVVIQGDAEAVRAAIGNIIENAAKYSTRDPRVHVALAPAEDGVAILIRDFCGGLTAEEMERMFDQYYRGDPARGPRGLGLGLYVAARIIDEFDWDISVENRNGAGCEFRVAIPGTVQRER
ncbi:MAG: GAF domain-containing sensor histidine kinase [Dehalococcoidia bacterium]